MQRKVFETPAELGGHALSYLEWNPGGEGLPVVCVHGLTRNALDFEALGTALAESGRHVVAIDVVGRGRSGRLTDPAAYGYPQYLAEASVFAEQLGVGQVDWVGTSMGGIIGMMLAAQRPNLSRRMVVTDVGPFSPKQALERIAEYLAAERRFDSLEHASAHLAEVYLPFGITDAALWRRFVEISIEGTGAGGYVPAYDPAIAIPFRDAHFDDVSFWDIWDAIRAEVLLLRGAQSDLLLAETAEEMRARGPGCRLVTFEGAGHAPPLLTPDQIDPVVGFLSPA